MSKKHDTKPATGDQDRQSETTEFDAAAHEANERRKYLEAQEGQNKQPIFTDTGDQDRTKSIEADPTGATDETGRPLAGSIEPTTTPVAAPLKIDPHPSAVATPPPEGVPAGGVSGAPSSYAVHDHKGDNTPAKLDRIAAQLNPSDVQAARNGAPTKDDPFGRGVKGK